MPSERKETDRDGRHADRQRTFRTGAADCQDRYGLERQAEKWFLRIGTVRRTKTVRTDEYRCETDDDTMPEGT